MKLQKLIFLAVLAFFTACHTSNLEQYLFDTAYNTVGELCISEDKLFDPRFLIVVDSLLIVGNNKQSPLIEIHNLNSGKLQNSFLNIGNGPHEVLTIGNVQVDKNKKKLYVSDLFQRKLFRYRIEDIFIDLSPLPEVVFERSENSSLIFDKLYMTENHLIAESRNPRGRILLTNSNGEETGYYLSYPNKSLIDENLSDNNNAELYASAITVKPSLDKVALATYNAGMIDICRIENNEVISEWNYTSFYPQGIISVPMGETTVVAHTSESKTGFLSASSTECHVYCLFSGKLMEDKTYPYGNEVYVVDWQGKETYKIILDKLINRLAVDHNDEYIYGITPEMDIFRFKIPKP